MSIINLKHSGEMIYMGDAPNAGDMQEVQDNLDRIKKVQDDYWDWKNKQENH